MLVSAEVRTCRKCDTTKPIDDFYVIGATYREWTCKACKVACANAWRDANRDRWNATRHRSQTKKRLGITDEQYDAAYTDHCAACGATEQLCVDHNHATGATRGTLCRTCNLAVGWVKDDPTRLRALADYLERGGAA